MRLLHLIGGQTMARGRKKATNFTPEEKLKMIEKEISSYEEKLKELRSEKKDLSKQIEDAKKETLYRAVVQSGRSIEEILQVLSDKEENK